MNEGELVAEMIDLIVKVAASAKREQQASIARQVEALHARLAELPSLDADVRARLASRKRELREQDDTRPMATIPQEKPR